MGLLWTTVRNETNHKSPERIIHEEKRAATDESIRLAKEYEEKIYSQIAEKLVVNNNLFTFSLAFSRDAYLYTVMYVKIKINDSEYSENFKLDSFSEVNPEKVAETLKKWLSEKILMQPLMSIFEAYYSKNILGYRIIDNKFSPKDTK